MEHTRVSMAGVMASSGGAILAAASAVLLSTSLAFANPDGGTKVKPISQGPIGGGKTHLGVMPDQNVLDLPMQPVKLGDKPQFVPPPKPIPADPPEDEAGQDPRDTPPPTFFGETIDTATNSIIYVIDISGSMSIVSNAFEDENGKIISNGNRLDRAKAELKRSIAGLSDSFFFNVIIFDECTSQCWGSKQQASPGNKANAFAWIEALQPDGWTNTGLAVQSALSDKDNKTIVLLSDGAPNFLDCAMNYVGSFDDHAKLIRSANTQNAVVNTFGIGIANDQDARGFMMRVASENGGTYTDVN